MLETKREGKRVRVGNYGITRRLGQRSLSVSDILVSITRQSLTIVVESGQDPIVSFHVELFVIIRDVF